jgi:hypothetical protein
MGIFNFRKKVISLESIFINEVWQEIQRLVLKKKIKKFYIVTPANYEYLQSLYNLKISRIDLANLMVKRYRWLLEHGQELELKLYLTRLSNNITAQEQEIRLRQALHFMSKGLRIKPTEILIGWSAYNKDTESILNNYKLKLIEGKKSFIDDYDLIKKKK